MSGEHSVDATQVHHDWDNSREPAVAIQSGDVVHFDLPMTGEGQVSEASAPGVEVPIGPFLGTMGVHTDEPGQHSPFPPHKGAGNVDNRHLVVGSTLWIPIWCEGALFSCGDAHAAQGDGEVCVTGIECPMRASLRLTVRRQTSVAPSFRVPADAQRARGDYHGTMGIDPDLHEGARKAVRAMIAWIVENHGLKPEDAYV